MANMRSIDCGGACDEKTLRTASFRRERDCERERSPEVVAVVPAAAPRDGLAAREPGCDEKFKSCGGACDENKACARPWPCCCCCVSPFAPREGLAAREAEREPWREPERELGCDEKFKSCGAACDENKACLT